MHTTDDDAVDQTARQRNREAVHRIDVIMRERAQAKERAFAADLEAWRSKRIGPTRA